MRRLLSFLLFASLPAAAAVPGGPCEPPVTINGAEGTADFRKCPGAQIGVKANVILILGSVTYGGYVSSWVDDQARFQLNEPVRSGAGSGRLVIEGQEFTIRPRFAGRSDPRDGGQRTVQLPQAPASQSRQSSTPAPRETPQSNGRQTPRQARPETPADPQVRQASIPIDHDIVSLIQSEGSPLRGNTSAGNYALLRQDGVWEVRIASPPVDPASLPLRYADPARRVGNDGQTVAASGRREALPKPVNAFSFPEALAVGDDGFAARQAGNGWQQIRTGVDRDLYGAATFQRRAWIVGQSGLLLRLEPEGVWRVTETGVATTLRGVSFSSDGTGFAVGGEGVILRSTDWGASWTRMTRGAQLPGGIPLPAPWYVLLNLLVTVPALVLAARGRPQESEIEQTESIADQLVSDRAIEAGDPDHLNLRSIALGLSAFLRNEKTVPPLTVAVTGEWGSGKSSLMNLLKADLSEWGFRPVWFNAWHHQKEQHLLASLIQAIRREATPPWWHIGFRARLLWTRCRQHPLLVSALLLVLAVLAGYERAHPDHRIVEPFLAALRNGTFWEFVIDLPEALQDEFAFLLSIAGAVTGLWKGVQSFAARPAALLARFSSRPALSALDEEISFRGRFAPEFRDVTTALGDRPLVLFVDDLDRCQPDSVREMLEAINFLITAGNCFVILGIDRTRVERYVNLAFGRAAEEEPNFAANYLDKLINIEVPIPAPDDRQALSILRPAEQPEEQARPAVDRLRAAMAAAWSLKPAAVALALIWIGAGIGSTMHPPSPPAVEAAGTVSPLPPDTPGATQASAIPGVKTGERGEVMPGRTRRAAITQWPVAVFLLAIGAVAAWLFTRRPGLVVHDSEEFVAALEAWQPLLVARNRTPRSLKRFLNRVRYLAMLQRPQEEPSTMWRTVRAALTGKRLPPPLVPGTDPIPEPLLVALAAMTCSARDGRNHEEQLRESQTRHIRRFGTLAIDAWKPVFERISSDVRT